MILTSEQSLKQKLLKITNIWPDSPEDYILYPRPTGYNSGTGRFARHFRRKGRTAGDSGAGTEPPALFTSVLRFAALISASASLRMNAAYLAFYLAIERRWDCNMKPKQNLKSALET